MGDGGSIVQRSFLILYMVTLSLSFPYSRTSVRLHVGLSTPGSSEVRPLGRSERLDLCSIGRSLSPRYYGTPIGVVVVSSCHRVSG